MMSDVNYIIFIDISIMPVGENSAITHPRERITSLDEPPLEYNKPYERTIGSAMLLLPNP
jgi:hypothetical protein